MGTDRGEHRARALVQVNVRDVVFFLGVERSEDRERFRFIEINPAFSDATGLSPEQVVGKFVDEVIPEPSLSLVLEKYRAALREQRTVRWEEVTAYPAGKRYGQVSVTPLIDGDGQCRTLVGTVHDVTPEAHVRALLAAEKRVLEMVASGQPLEQTLEALVLEIEDLAPPAIASVLLVTDDGERVMHGAAPHLPEAYNRAIEGRRVGPKEGSCGTAAALNKQIIVTDVQTDPLWDTYRDLATEHGLRACWSTPVCSMDGRVLGTFALYYREPRAPTPEDLDVIGRAVHIASIAIERHELDTQLRDLSYRIEAAREDERTGIAREIHDQLGQALTVLKMDLAWITRRALKPEGIETTALLEKVNELSSMTDEIIGQVRRISSELRPGVLDDLGLVPAISWKLQDFEKRTEIKTKVSADLDGVKPSRTVATTVYRVLEEALTNIARHAEAKQVTVDLDEEEGTIVLIVRDDGKGIKKESVTDKKSLGLLGIRERARRHGGTATVTSLEPNGTELVLRLPAT